MQIISLVREIFKEEGLDLWLRPYTIVCVGDQAGKWLRGSLSLFSFLCSPFLSRRKLIHVSPSVLSLSSHPSGLIEAVADAKSIDHIKKRAPYFTHLREYYERIYGIAPYSRTFREAQKNFMRSLAGYCIVTYLMQVMYVCMRCLSSLVSLMMD